MDNPIKIAQAWVNVFIKDPKVEKEAKRRAEICGQCDFAKYGKILKFVKDDLKEVEGMYCSDCNGCPLIAKIRGEVICKKWKADTKQ